VKRVFILVLAFSLGIPLLLVHAQYDKSFITDDPLILSISQPNPKPGEAVTFTVTTYSFDLDRSNVRWTVNGKVVLSGIGEKRIQTTLGTAGQTTTVGVVVSSSAGTFSKTFSVKPVQDVDLVWEAKSYTPPFYKGKALFSYQGEVTVEAIPNFFQGGKRINPKNLVYTWKNDGNNIPSASGYGKNSVKLQPQGINIQPLDISVTVSSLDNSLTGIGSTVIGTQQSSGVFYIYSSLYGTLYNHALPQNFELKDSEITIERSPYFFSVSSPYSNQAVSYTWSINNQAIPSQSAIGNRILLKRPANTAGISLISVKATSLDKLLQYDTAGISISFGND
jgi:hypothetical protein